MLIISINYRLCGFFLHRFFHKTGLMAPKTHPKFYVGTL